MKASHPSVTTPSMLPDPLKKPSFRPFAGRPSTSKSSIVALSLSTFHIRNSGSVSPLVRWVSRTADRNRPSNQAAFAIRPTDTPTMTPLFHFFQHSTLQQLSSESPENLSKSLASSGNRHPGRPVFNGHFVRVRPTPLRNPKVVIHSEEMARELGLRDPGLSMSDPFVRFFSGDVDVAGKQVETWATPYALSIMGKRYTNNCPYGTGDGYGDGRAISVGEVVVPRVTLDQQDNHPHGLNSDEFLSALYPHHADRYELQLKGAGQTPFCRGADGRAVLRSSIREFLASEAMHWLGVSTTRALCLIVSENGDTSQRPWYSNASDGARNVRIPTVDDPRLAQYTLEERRDIVARLAAQVKADPDTLVEEKCAITTRVARSFVRVGHLDLFARRVERVKLELEENDDPASASLIRESIEYQELEEIMWHACYREYYDTAYLPHWERRDAMNAALALMEGAMVNIAKMVAGWIRVGFVQGNFNADNCLIGGRTMDYGPFGFLDVYHPLSAKWTGSGEHFGFMNQPKAGFANFAVLVESLLPIIDAYGGNIHQVRDEMLTKAQKVFAESVDQVIRAKLGLDCGSAETLQKADDLWEEIEPLLRTARADWTLFWRQLTYVASTFLPSKGDNLESNSFPENDKMLEILLGDENTNPFYDTLTDENKVTLGKWLEKWGKALTHCHNNAATQSNIISKSLPEERMCLVNPKYTLREWMLVEAYSLADVGKFLPGNYTLVHHLFELSKDPYGEGSSENHLKYYRRAPDESLKAGGTAFMS